MEEGKTEIQKEEEIDRKELGKSLVLRNEGSYLNGLKVKKIGGFDKVEMLTLLNFHEQGVIESTIEQFPNVRTLIISDMSHRTNAEIFSIMMKCRHMLELQKIIIGSLYHSHNQDDDQIISDYKLNVQFHEKFREAMDGLKLTRIEFIEKDKIIGFVTKDEIIWRNKLLHWSGYHPSLSQSEVKLLDLVSIPKDSKHKQPLNLIFNYLDLNSLYAFCQTNKDCKQLIHNYVYQRCKQQSKQRPNQRSMQRSKLVLCDEFGMDYNALRLFGKSITYLEINLIDYLQRRLFSDIEKYCKCLTILCLRTLERLDPQNLIFTSVRHYIFYGYGNGPDYIFHCDFSEFPKKCPDLEICEFKTPIRFYRSHQKSKNQFRSLQKFTFKPYDNNDLKFAEDFFKDSGTEIVVLK